MKLGFQFGTKFIDFEVEYRNRKNLTIEVEPTEIGRASCRERV